MIQAFTQIIDKLITGIFQMFSSLFGGAKTGENPGLGAGFSLQDDAKAGEGGKKAGGWLDLVGSLVGGAFSYATGGIGGVFGSLLGGGGGSLFKSIGGLFK
jgi:hypothetical protein